MIELSKHVAVLIVAREKVRGVKIYSDNGAVTLSLDDLEKIKELLTKNQVKK